MSDITLEGIKALRDTISATVHDVLYYMSPAYCQQIVHSVRAHPYRSIDAGVIKDLVACVTRAAR